MVVFTVRRAGREERLGLGCKGKRNTCGLVRAMKRPKNRGTFSQGALEPAMRILTEKNHPEEPRTVNGTEIKVDTCVPHTSD